MHACVDVWMYESVLTGVLPWPPVVAAGEDVANDMFIVTLLLLLDDLRERD